MYLIFYSFFYRHQRIQFWRQLYNLDAKLQYFYQKEFSDVFRNVCGNELWHKSIWKLWKTNGYCIQAFEIFFTKHLVQPSFVTLSTRSKSIYTEVSVLKSVELNMNKDGRIGSVWTKPPYSETFHKVAAKYVCIYMIYIYNMCMYTHT